MTNGGAADSEKGTATVLWWVGWILITIVTFFISCAFWTRVIAEKVGSISRPGVTILWVSAVFGTWMLMLIPLIIVMYRKVDKAYEDSRIARETAQFEKAKASFKVRGVFVDESRRRLSKDLSDKLKRWPETIRRGHLVTAVLRDGRKIENVFVLRRREILGIYGVREMSFRAEDIRDLEPVSAENLPAFKSELWLRLDGVGTEEA